MKEIDLLKRQNNTFKKELANYRRENGNIRRELEDSKSI
jgi:FtsZ-binding cell division protein ZapB